MICSCGQRMKFVTDDEAMPYWDCNCGKTVPEGFWNTIDRGAGYEHEQNQ